MKVTTIKKAKGYVIRFEMSQLYASDVCNILAELVQGRYPSYEQRSFLSPFVDLLQSVNIKRFM